MPTRSVFGVRRDEAAQRGRGGVHAHHDGRAVPREPKQEEGEVEQKAKEELRDTKEARIASGGDE